MAIEALRQVHENDNLSFDGVTISDVDINTALVVPEGDGIEIVTCLHTTNDQSYTFTLESVAAEEWTLHCKGRISANSGSIIARDHPVEEAALTQRASGKRWYEAFQGVGFNYINTFQRLLDARSDKSVRHSAGNLVVSQSSGQMDYESRYMLHPTSIDACLQLIIVAVNAGKHKEMQWGVVPTHIGQISLAFPEGETESTGHAVAWTEKIEGRQYHTHACLKDATGKLVMDIDGLTCTAYEAVVPPKVEVIGEPEPFSTMTWKPDIEALSSEGESKFDSLTDLVELVCHKQPVKSVLICGNPSPGVLESALDILPHNCSITIGFAAEQQVPHIGEHLRDRVTVKASSEEWSTGAEELQFDLLIADYFGFDASDAPIDMDGLTPLIGNGGWLVGARHCFSSLPQKAISSGRHFAYRPAKAGHTSDVATATSDISLLSTAPSSPDLASALTKCGRTVHEKQPSEFLASDHQCVIIDDRKGTTLLSPTEAEFSYLKAILASGNLLLWLTQGVQEGASAEGGLAEGFLRVIRSEQASARVVLLDIDNAEPIQDVAQAIIGRIDALADLSPTSDTEYWLHEGVLRISRLYPYVPQSMRTCQEDQPIPQEKQITHQVVKVSPQETKLTIKPSNFLPLLGLALTEPIKETIIVKAPTIQQPEPLPSIVQPTVDVPDSIKVIEPTLSSEGTYVLVGCLGGLGRSLTKWMMEHGAKHFAFISRSGASKPEAARVIESIEKCPGTSTRVYRADAADELAVQCIIYSLQAERSIRGVVHAAMVLQVRQKASAPRPTSLLFIYDPMY